MKKLSYIFFVYVMKNFVKKFSVVFLLFSFVILLINSIENVKRFYGKNFDFTTLLKISILKYPYLIDQLFPLIIFISTILTFLRFNKNSEIIIFRASGLSTWQFLYPAIFTSFVLGILTILIFNPIVAISLTKYERIANRFVDRSENNILSISKSGLWLKEKPDDEVSPRIMRARQILTHELLLYDVIIFNLSSEHEFVSRIDAKTAKLIKNQENNKQFWLLDEVRINAIGEPEVKKESMMLPTNVMLQGLQDSFSKPQTLPFWEFVGFIEILNEAGFSALNHKIFFGKLLIRPFFMASMVLAAGVFALRFSRLDKNAPIIFLGLLLGFAIYFFEDVTSALGLSGSIPMTMSVISPFITSSLIGSLLILHYEDG